MKLIDLLVRETLSGHFKWPEKANKMHQDYDGELCPDFGYRNLYIKDVAENHRERGVSGCELGDEFFVTREQYEAALAAAQQPVWNGDGLPPVGCKVERSLCGDRWSKCEIIFISNETVVVKFKRGEVAYRVNEVKFRPIRSEADKKRDAAIGAIDLELLLVRNPSKTAEAIYEVIAAGKVPGVKIF